MLWSPLQAAPSEHSAPNCGDWSSPAGCRRAGGCARRSLGSGAVPVFPVDCCGVPAQPQLTPSGWPTPDSAGQTGVSDAQFLSPNQGAACVSVVITPGSSGPWPRSPCPGRAPSSITPGALCQPTAGETEAGRPWYPLMVLGAPLLLTLGLVLGELQVVLEGLPGWSLGPASSGCGRDPGRG